MLVRVISAVVMLAIFIPCLFLSHTFLFDAVITLLCVMACFEMLGCIKLKKVFTMSVPSLLLGAFVPLCVRTINTGVTLSELILLVFIVFLFLLLGIAVFSHGKYKVQDVATAFVLIFYIIFGFSSILAIRGADKGQYLFLLIFISAWIPDTGAYFTGVLFGKHKLIPDVSPKKTVEGAIGGLAFGIIAFIVYGVIMQNLYDLTPNYLLLGCMGLILAVVSMCGDLVASLVKRQYDLKDYSKLIPGHGGIMDRFDSIIATASVLFVLLNIPFVSQNIL